jgi:energy-coupling factor transporter transmembrane protein EcfT
LRRCLAVAEAAVEEVLRATAALLEASGRAGRARLSAAMLLASCSTIALTGSAYAALAAVASSTLLLYRAGRRSLKQLKHVASIALLVVAIQLPLLAMQAGGVALSLALRTLPTLLLLSAYTVSLGWRPLTSVLGLAAPQLALASELLVFQATRWAHATLALLAARRARMLKRPGTLATWRLLGSSVGELLARSMVAASSLAMAVSSRSLAKRYGSRPKLELDIGYTVLASTPLAVAAAEGLQYWLL